MLGISALSLATTFWLAKYFSRVCSSSLFLVLLLLPELTLAAPKDSAMPNGTWVIETQAPADTVKLCMEYLPAGTKLQLQVAGPTRKAIERDIGNELGGTLTLQSPVTDTICRTGLGAETGFGLNLCSQERLTKHPNSPAQFDDAVFTFSRLSKDDIEDVANEFFVQRGAKVGARFATLLLKDKGIQWELWLRAPNEMLSECVYQGQGKNNFQSFPMIWRRDAK